MEFQKPKRVVIPLRPFVEKLIDGKITKDLCEGEEVCPTCGGFGLRIENNPFGLEGDPNNQHGAPLFPYKHQSLVLQYCPTCYNGVVHRCKLCGKIMKRGWLKHDCPKQQALDREKREREDRERFDKAEIAPPEIADACEYFYSEYYPLSEGYFSDWDDFFDQWDEQRIEMEDAGLIKRPEFVWITEPVEMHIDAEFVAENATEELYEDAMSDISTEDIKRLQALLDDWCKSCGVSTTYQESHKYKVRIPWEEYDRRKEHEG